MRRIPSIACCALAAMFALPAAAAPIIGIVNSVSLTSYQNYLDNYLYTSLGNNRGLSGAEHDLARANIVSQLAALGLTPALEAFTYSGSTYYNVVARKQGTSSASGVYMVGAHYDSAGNPGADDDASGVAGVLEIARVLSTYSFSNTIVFALFDREEQGLIGSTAYLPLNLEPVLGMIQLDMIAYDVGTGAARIFSGGSTAAWDLGLAQALSTYGGVPSTFSGISNQSDHAPFRNAGYPAALVIEDGYQSNPCYHQACDAIQTPGYISYTLGTSITRGVAGYLAEQADVPEPATWLLLLAGLSLVVGKARRHSASPSAAPAARPR